MPPKLSIKSLSRAAAAAALAAGIGTVVLQAQTRPADLAADSRAAPGALAGTPACDTPRVADMAEPDAGVALPRQAEIPVPPQTDGAPRQVSALGLPCGLSVEARAMPGAMVALDVMAPCQTETRVVIEHSGLTLIAETDALGLLTLDIPAFETPAFFNIELPDGLSETALVGLPDLFDYHRVAVQWDGRGELSLHAMEFGAAFGDTGHVWQESPATLDAALTGTGGFLLELGDPTRPDAPRAQVYTLPRSALRAGDTVRLSVDAAITPETCGQPLSAHALQMDGTGRVELIPLSLTMPGCDAVGDYLLLQNLLQDLRLAAN